MGREEGEILFPVLLQALKWQCYLKRSYRGWGRGSGSLGKVFTRKHEPLSSIPNAHIEKKGAGGGGGLQAEGTGMQTTIEVGLNLCATGHCRGHTRME